MENAKGCVRGGMAGDRRDFGTRRSGGGEDDIGVFGSATSRPPSGGRAADIAKTNQSLASALRISQGSHVCAGASAWPPGTIRLYVHERNGRHDRRAAI